MIALIKFAKLNLAISLFYPMLNLQGAHGVVGHGLMGQGLVGHGLVGQGVVGLRVPPRVRSDEESCDNLPSLL